MATLPTQKTTKYLIYHQGDISGPFDLSFIEGMVLGGIYSNSLKMQQEGTRAWVSFLDVGNLTALGGAVTTNGANISDGNSGTTPSNGKPTGSPEIHWAGVVFGISAILAAIFLYTCLLYTSPSPRDRG